MYQPQWRDGREVGVGRRDAAGRYRAIAEYLHEAGFAPGGRILDFGAYGGYFASRLAEEFDAKCVAVDDSKKLNLDLPGVTVVRDRVTPSGISKLGQFDVVLCLSVLHHQTNWKTYLNALLAAGKVVFIETSHPDESLPKARAQYLAGSIHKTVSALADNRVLTSTPGYDKRYQRPLWVVDQREPEKVELQADPPERAPDGSADDDLDVFAASPLDELSTEDAPEYD